MEVARVDTASWKLGSFRCTEVEAAGALCCPLTSTARASAPGPGPGPAGCSLPGPGPEGTTHPPLRAPPTAPPMVPPLGRLGHGSVPRCTGVCRHHCVWVMNLVVRGRGLARGRGSELAGSPGVLPVGPGPCGYEAAAHEPGGSTGTVLRWAGHSCSGLPSSPDKWGNRGIGSCSGPGAAATPLPASCPGLAGAQRCRLRSRAPRCVRFSSPAARLSAREEGAPSCQSGFSRRDPVCACTHACRGGRRRSWLAMGAI